MGVLDGAPIRVRHTQKLMVEGVSPNIRAGPNAGSGQCMQWLHAHECIETERIIIRNGIRRTVEIRIQSTIQSDGVALDVSPRLRIIVPCVVVDRSARRESSYAKAFSPMPSSA